MPSYKAQVENNACYVSVWVAPAMQDGQSQQDIIQTMMQNNAVLRALIDTGATGSCVTKKVVEAINVFPISKGMMTSASGVTDANIYDISLSLPIRQRVNEGYSEAARTFSSLSVMQIADNERFDVLLGMDFLADCNFILAHGEFIISI